MDPRTAASPAHDQDAVEFVRFCYRRRRVGWPELYDEMCAVAGRGLFRGYSSDDLAAHGIGFGLFDMPALAALARRIVEEEKAARRPVTVVITEDVDETSDVSAHIAGPVEVIAATGQAEPVTTAVVTRAEVAPGGRVPEAATPAEPRIRFAPVPAGA